MVQCLLITNGLQKPATPISRAKVDDYYFRPRPCNPVQNYLQKKLQTKWWLSYIS